MKNRNGRKRVGIFSLLVVASLVVIFLFVFVGSKNTTGQNRNNVKENVVIVKKSNIISTADLSGTVYADPRINLLSEVTGRIKKIYVKDGDSVKNGQNIMDIDLSKTLYGRSEVVTITSPIKGKVLLLNVSEGDTVFPRSMLGVIGGDNFIAKFYADELDAVNIKKGQKAVLSFEAYPDKKFDITVESVSYTVVTTQQGVKAYLVTVKIPQEEYSYMKDGLSANIKIITAEKKNVLIVPIESVGSDSSGSFVDLIDEHGNIKKTYVKTGISSDDFTEIVSGLKEGDKILETPRENIFENIGVKAPFGMFKNNGN